VLASGKELLGERTGEVAMAELDTEMIVVPEMRVGDAEAHQRVKNARGGVLGVNVSKVRTRALRNLYKSSF
jgi:hypothetical protein